MNKTIAAKIIIYGFVQGVGFRSFIYKHAIKNNVKGYVLNREDGGVEALFVGNKEDVINMLELAKSEPGLSKIDDIIEDITEDKNIVDKLFKKYENFHINY